MQPKNKITALYCRLSKEDELEKESNSIFYQKDLLENYAKENGFNNTKFFIDDGYSGTDFNRPGFMSLIDMVEKGEVSTVLVKDMSRFGRNHLWVGIYTEEVFPSHGVRFIAIHDNYDSAKSEAFSDISIPIKNLMNEWYAADTSRKVRASKKAKGLKGESLASMPPYGYLKDPENNAKWIVDEEVRDVIVFIFGETLKGNGPVKISKMLEEKGILNPTAYKRAKNIPIANKSIVINDAIWNTSTLYNILRNIAYCGHTLNFKTYRLSFKDHRRRDNPKENHVLFKDSHEAIISESTFEEVQRMRETKLRPMKNNYENVFREMLKCADCGSNLYLVKTKHQSYFHCGRYKKRSASFDGCTQHYVREDKLKETVSFFLKSIMELATVNKERLVETFMKKRDKHMYSHKSKLQREEKELLKRLEQIEVIIKKLYEDLVFEKISDNRFKILNDEYEIESKTAKERLLEIGKELFAATSTIDEVKQLEGLVKDFTSVEPLTTELIHSFIEKIIVGEDNELTIVLKLMKGISLEDIHEVTKKIRDMSKNHIPISKPPCTADQYKSHQSFPYGFSLAT